MKITEKLNAYSRLNHETGCIEWVRARDTNGYGAVYDGVKQRLAHRVAYEVHKGPIPNGLTIDHRCKNKACINPDHLEAVTHQVNCRRAVSPEIDKNMCVRGHLIEGRNAYLEKSGRRTCRQCRNDRGWAKSRAEGRPIRGRRVVTA